MTDQRLAKNRDVERAGSRRLKDPRPAAAAAEEAEAGAERTRARVSAEHQNLSGRTCNKKTFSKSPNASPEPPGGCRRVGVTPQPPSPGLTVGEEGRGGGGLMDASQSGGPGFPQSLSIPHDNPADES